MSPTMRVSEIPSATETAPDRLRALVRPSAFAKASADRSTGSGRAFCGPLVVSLSNHERRSVNVVVGRFGAERAARALHEERFDEAVDVAVQHAVDIAD